MEPPRLREGPTPRKTIRATAGDACLDTLDIMD